ncbi:Cartilage matrix protein [Bulinus truncatus]|nr:Cartilage matrix protein [Bulinus truncatus]
MIAVGIGIPKHNVKTAKNGILDLDELEVIAGSEDRVLLVESYSTLNSILKNLTEKYCFDATVYQQKPIDIALLIDSTVSIGSEENFTLGIKFIQEILKDFDMRRDMTRFGAVMFGNRVYTESVIPFDYERNKNETLAALSNLKWMQGTSTATGLGIDYMVNNFVSKMRDDVARVGVVITDGQSQNSTKTKQAAKDALKKNIRMIAIGVGKVAKDLEQLKNGELNYEELVEIAGDKKFVLTVGDYATLLNMKNQLLSRLCVRTVSRNCSSIHQLPDTECTVELLLTLPLPHKSPEKLSKEVSSDDVK